MKGFIPLLACLIMLNSAFAAITTASPVAHVVSQVASKTQAVGEKPVAHPKVAQTPTPTPQTGYYEIMGGMGLAQVNVGKSELGITPTEVDRIVQTNSNLQGFLGHAGIGYVHFLSMTDRCSDKLIWLPSIEPILSLYYYDLLVKGDVLRFNDPTLNTSTFKMPIRSVNLMVDVLLSLVSYNHFSLFVFGGVGEAWTQINYSDGPNASGNTLPALKLGTNNQANAAYDWGTGIAYSFNPCVKLALKYVYSHIGDISTAGTGSLGGVPDSAINPASFSLRTQSVLLDVHIALS